MEAEQVSSANRLATTQTQPRGGSVEGGQLQSAPAADTAPTPTQDTVTLSSQGRQAVRQEGSGEGAGEANLQRELDVTDNHQVVLKILDGQTQKVVKQIPPEEQVRLKQAIQDVVESQTEAE